MKIKYRSNYKDGTDWSKSATYNILALNQLGHEVELEEVTYNNGQTYIHPDIQRLEGIKLDKHDIVFNHVLPVHFTNFADTVNVGVAALETKTLDNKFWLKKISLMDHVITPTLSTENALRNLGVESELFNPLFDFDYVFSSNHTINIPYLKTGYNMLFIGDTSKVKNLEAALRAFHGEFEPFEKVNLVIITNDPKTEEFCNSVKRKMKLSSRAKKEVIVTGPLRDEDRFSVMRYCHANLVPSFGESWNYGLLEGLALGILPIFCNEIGFENILSDDYSYPVKSEKVECYGANESFDDLQTSKDMWQEISVPSLRCQMRISYNHFTNYLEKHNEVRAKATNSVMRFSYNHPEALKDMEELLEKLK